MKFEFTNWRTQENPWKDRLSQKAWRNLNIVGQVMMFTGLVLNFLAKRVIEKSIICEILGSVLMALGILMVIAGMNPEDEYDEIFKWGFATMIMIGLVAMAGMGMYNLFFNGQ